jgi:hypothetical protein
VVRRALGLVAVAGVACTDPGDGVEPPRPPLSPWGAPISGGTLLVTRDDARAVIADPDRDRVLVVDLGESRVVTEHALPAASEPGRVIEDGAGRLHVALRRGGAVWTLAQGEAHLRPVCAEPRGLAWDEARDEVHVACATGELVSLRADDGTITRTRWLDRDLRDVLVSDGRLRVTRFRAAEVLELDDDGAISERTQLPGVRRNSLHASVESTPAVAWRTIALPDGSLVVAHQRNLDASLRVEPGGYDSICATSIVETAVSWLADGAPPRAVAPFLDGALPVDVAIDHAGARLAFALAGNNSIQEASTSVLAIDDDDECPNESTGSAIDRRDVDLGTPSSVAYRRTGALLAFYPELPALVVRDGSTTQTIVLPGPVGYDPGRALFHAETQLGLACASCHPEGREDGQVWTFSGLGPRRTQSLAGALVSRAPYHWDGDMPSIYVLVLEVFAGRMGGDHRLIQRARTIEAWLDRIPAPRAPAGDPEVVARGAALFTAPEQGCASCHSGPLFTNNKLANVGTGGMFKTPSLLGVGARLPLLHDGCAATIRDRFGPCGGGDQHGQTSHLTEDELAELVAYLDSI